MAESSSSLSTGITSFPAPTPPLTYSVQGEINGFSAMCELSSIAGSTIYPLIPSPIPEPSFVTEITSFLPLSLGVIYTATAAQNEINAIFDKSVYPFPIPATDESSSSLAIGIIDFLAAVAKMAMSTFLVNGIISFLPLHLVTGFTSGQKPAKESSSSLVTESTSQVPAMESSSSLVTGFTGFLSSDTRDHSL